MKHKIVIEYETPEVLDRSFNGKVAEMYCTKALGDYLNNIESIRKQALEKLYKITSSTNESHIER